MIGVRGPSSLGEVSSVCVCLLTPPRIFWSGACVDRKFLTWYSRRGVGVSLRFSCSSSC